MASVMLRMFVRDVRCLYGPTYYSYNLHTVLHYPILAKRWGLLWSTSTFLFENHNAILGALIHGKRNKGQELVNKIKLSLGVVSLRNFVERRGNRGVRSRTRFSCSCRGRPVEINLTCEQESVLSEANLLSYPFYRRAQLQAEIYTSFLYDETKKRSNSYVQFLKSSKEVGYAQIMFFVKSDDKVFVLLRIFDVEHIRIFIHRESLLKVSHLVPCKESKHFLVVPAKQICSKVVRVGGYFALRPNTIERNL